MVANRWGIPDLGLGLGLRSDHYDYILENRPKVDFFEIISETYLTGHGRSVRLLDQIAEHYPIVMHGVSLSIGSTDPLNLEFIQSLKKLTKRYNVPYVSDHLCWTGILGRNTHDLLPVPLTESTLKHVVGRIRQVQDMLECPLALENPSNYLEFTQSQMPEYEFMTRMVEEADSALLLDLNNIYVSAFNHGFDAKHYVDQIPPERVLHHHLAGHTNKGTHILDTHSDHVIDPVWDLYERFHARSGGRSTLVEWDDDIPPFEVLMAEIAKAQVCRDRVAQAKAQELSSRG
jgi:uncharacterized protein (UPF0276 family)